MSTCAANRASRCICAAMIVLIGLLSGRPAAADLLADPRFAEGAKSRLDQFIRRGADPREAETIFRKLNDLDPERWVDEWVRLAQPLEREAAALEAKGKASEAMNAWLKASAYYSIAKFPIINHPAKRAAYLKCIETFLKAARYFNPPLERVTIPFEGKEIVAYLRLPKGLVKPPVVIATGGVDNYKEDRDVSDLLGAGIAAFSMDMPGAGECPVWYTTDAERVYTAAIDYLVKRPDLDGTRIGILGRSYGGYWGAKMAYVERDRLKAAVQAGGPIHYTFQEAWIRQILNDKLYLWPLVDSMIYASNLKDLDDLIRFAPTLSLKAQGWLDKPSAPMLVINGKKDPWITIEDSYILLEGGDAKAARIFPEGGHMGRGQPGGTGDSLIEWLRIQLYGSAGPAASQRPKPVGK